MSSGRQSLKALQLYAADSEVFSRHCKERLLNASPLIEGMDTAMMIYEGGSFQEGSQQYLNTNLR
jgi:hypothetical protein